MSLHWEQIDRLVKAHRAEKITDLPSLRRFLQIWWCMKYSRPFKDPLFQTYTLDELAYEYLTHHYLDPENDPEKKNAKAKLEEADQAWIEQQLSGGLSPPPSPGPVTPTPENPGSPDLPDISTRFD